MFKNKNFSCYIMGRFISLLGSGIQMIALPLYILDLTGSGTLMGIFSILTLVPMLISAPFAGIFGDRKNRRNIMIITDVGRGTAICFMAILAIHGNMNIAVLFGIQVLVSIMDSFFNASTGALMPELVSEEELMQATSIKGTLDGIAMIIGPFLGGLIYSFGGIKTVFLLNGVSFYFCAVSSLFIIYKKATSEKEKISKNSFLKENGEAIGFIKSKKGLLQLFTFALISNFLLSPMFDIIFPYALKKEIGFSADKYGIIFGCFTLGIVLGNIAIGSYFKNWSSKKLIKTGLILETMIVFLCCGFMFPLAVSFFGGASYKLFGILSVGVFTVGFFNAFVNTPISVNLQKMVPDIMRARFFSLLGMFSQGAVPIGAFIYGLLLDKIKYFYLFGIINVLSIGITIYFLINACEEAYEPKSEAA